MKVSTSRAKRLNRTEVDLIDRTELDLIDLDRFRQGHPPQSGKSPTPQDFRPVRTHSVAAINPEALEVD